MRYVALVFALAGCSSPAPGSCDTCTSELARLEAEVRYPDNTLALGLTIRAINLATNEQMMTARELGEGHYAMIDDGDAAALLTDDQTLHVTFDGGAYYAARDFTVSTDACHCHVMPSGVVPVWLGMRY